MFFKVFDYFYFTLLAGCALVGLLFWGRYRKGIKLLGVFIFITLFVEITARWMLKKYNQNNAIYIFYDILNLAITASILISFMASKKNKIIIVFTDAIFLGIYFFDVLFMNRYVTDYSLINCLISILICFLSCMFLLDKIQNPQERILYKTPEFLFSIFLLFFYAVSMLYWIIFIQFRGPDTKAITSLMFKFFLISNLIYYSGIFLIFILEANSFKKGNERKCS